MRTIGDQQLLKRINRSVLLRLLRRQPGLSRARLAQHSGLTKSTVSALVRELLDERWLSEASAPVAADGLGRPSTPLHVNDQVRVLLGLEIGVQQLRVVSVSLTGEVLDTLHEPLASEEVHSVCKQAARLVHQAWQALSDRGLLLSGVGVCLPGAVDDAAGLVRFAPNLGWRDVPVFALLRHALCAAGVPATSLHLKSINQTMIMNKISPMRSSLCRQTLQVQMQIQQRLMWLWMQQVQQQAQIILLRQLRLHFVS